MDVKKLVDERMAADPRLRSCMKRINSGKGTFADTAYYSSVSSEILGKVFGDNVLKISEADREAICMELLKGNYDRINQICQQVQLDLDREAGIHIRPQQAPFPEERAAQFAHSLVDKTVAEEVIKRRAANGSENISKSFHDDYIEHNAKFRSDAGLKCYITRTGSGTSCPWCSEVSGKFTFDDAPAGVFRRHDKCNCEIVYENGRTRQNLKGAVNEEGQRTKKWEVAEEVNVEPPKKFSSDEQPKGFKPKVLTAPPKNGKIKTDELFYTKDDPMREVLGSAYMNNRAELFDIINELEGKGIEIDISDSNNTMGYQPSASFTGGKPGRVKMHRDASISAWEHERMHALDDELSGWNGRSILSFDKEEHYQWEVRAYGEEIKRAKALGRQDIVERLEQLLEDERKAIFNET